MHFKLVYSVRELYFSRKEFSPMVFEYGGRHSVRVILRAPNEQEELRGHKDMFCECTSEFQAEPAIAEIFTGLKNGKLPPGSNMDYLPDYIRRDVINEDGTVKDGYILPLGVMPQRFQEFHDSVRNELSSYAENTVKVLRWLEDASGPHNPFGIIGFSWSEAGIEWNSFPHSIGADVEVRQGVYSGDQITQSVISMVSEKTFEPLGHELFREAWGQRHTNPRSSLVIGITAAESAVKGCVASLQPETKWLIENAPSPNLEKLLTEYIPKLPARNKIREKVILPPDTVLKPLKKGVHMRNIIVHGGKCSLTYDSLKEVLQAVKDLLWLMDYYCGRAWAIKHVREQTKQILGI